MSVLDKVREQKKRTEEQLTRGGSSFGFRWWRPEAGENRVRIMPQWEDGLEGQFWREVSQHWGVSPEQKGPVLCPKETPDIREDCPICDLVQQLRQDKGSAESQKLAKSLRAKKAYFLNVIVQKDPVYTAKDVAEFKASRPDSECPFEVNDPKIQVYACPITIFDQILGIINTSGEDITDLKSGRNIVIKKLPHKDPIKTRYECMPELKETDTKLDEPALNDLGKVGFKMDYDEMLNLLSSGPAAQHVASLPGEAVDSLTAGSTTSDDEEKSEVPDSSASDDANDLEAQMRQELGQ